MWGGLRDLCGALQRTRPTTTTMTASKACPLPLILGVSVLLPDRISARSQSHRRRAPAPQARCSGGCERSSLGRTTAWIELDKGQLLGGGEVEPRMSLSVEVFAARHAGELVDRNGAHAALQYPPTRGVPQTFRHNLSFKSSSASGRGVDTPRNYRACDWNEANLLSPNHSRHAETLSSVRLASTGLNPHHPQSRALTHHGAGLPTSKRGAASQRFRRRPAGARRLG